MPRAAVSPSDVIREAIHVFLGVVTTRSDAAMDNGGGHVARQAEPTSQGD